jgi:SAM-dependent methyltransferase
MTFRDHFSKQAKVYSQHRPGYPAALFEYLASLAPSHDLAWDCGTGNGQAALELAKLFRQVIATDASSKQIEHAFPHERVDYRVEKSESTTIETGTVDLITVGTAVHWFDFEGFYGEVRRVAKPKAILAVWTYELPKLEPRVDDWLEHILRITLKAYWPDRFDYVDKRYRTLPFPFEEIQPPRFAMETRWDLNCLVGFVASWSGTRRFIDTVGHHPFENQLDKLQQIWGDESLEKLLNWPLHLRVGKVKIFD